MKKLSSQELAATHRIFNHVNDLCNDYWGRKTPVVVKKFVSLNRWIMFPANNIESLRQGTEFPIPNIYVATLNRGLIADDNNGRMSSYIGVSCGNTEAMAWVARALEPRNVAFFISSLNAMGQGWTVSIEQKIKTCFQENTPEYEVVESFRARTVTAQQIRDAIQHSNDTLYKRDQLYMDEPVLWCVTIFNVSIQTTASDFDANMRDAFRFFGAFNLTRPHP